MLPLPVFGLSLRFLKLRRQIHRRDIMLKKVIIVLILSKNLINLLRFLYICNTITKSEVASVDDNKAT